MPTHAAARTEGDPADDGEQRYDDAEQLVRDVVDPSDRDADQRRQAQHQVPAAGPVYQIGVRWKFWKDRLGVGPRWPW